MTRSSPPNPEMPEQTAVHRRPRPGVWDATEGCLRCQRFAVWSVVAATQLRTITLPVFYRRLGLPDRPPIFVEQVHGTRVAVIDPMTAVPAQLWLPGYDGLVTQLRGVPLAIRTADCVPVFFYDPIHHAGGIAHAGWRGLASGIVTAVVRTLVERYQTDPGMLQVALGPAIRACCYEVREPLIAQFGPAVVRRRRQAYLDLAAVVREQALAAGVAPTGLADCGWCTACRTELFYSYRRDGPATGRLVSVFMLQ